MSDAKDVLRQALEWDEPHTVVEIDGKPTDFRIVPRDAIRAVLAEPCRYCGSPSCEGTHELGTAKRIEWLEAENQRLAAELSAKATERPLSDLAQATNRAEDAEERLRQIVCSCGESALTHRIDYGSPSVVRQTSDDGECALDQCGEWGAAGDWKARAEQAEARIKELERLHEAVSAEVGLLRCLRARAEASNRALVEAGDRLLDCVDLTKVYRSQIEAWDQAKREAGK